MVYGRESTPADSEKLGEWTLSNGESKTAVANVEVRAGDTIDFIVDCRESPAFDSYQWKFRIKASQWPKELVKGLVEFESRLQRCLEQPASPAKIDPWVQLCQVMLLSNEFAFVD